MFNDANFSLILISFSKDLKKFNFYYWFAFPALIPEEPFTCEGTQNITEVFSVDQVITEIE